MPSKKWEFKTLAQAHEEIQRLRDLPAATPSRVPQWTFSPSWGSGGVTEQDPAEKARSDRNRAEREAETSAARQATMAINRARADASQLVVEVLRVETAKEAASTLRVSRLAHALAALYPVSAA